MSIFLEYNKVLTGSADNYLSESSEDLATSLLEKFGSNDWSILSENWFKKDLAWQIKCAQTLSSGQSEKSLPILLEMLNLDNENLIEATVDSLRVLMYEGAKVKLNENQLKKVKKLANKGKVAEIIASDFLKLLSLQNS